MKKEKNTIYLTLPKDCHSFLKDKKTFNDLCRLLLSTENAYLSIMLEEENYNEVKKLFKEDDLFFKEVSNKAFRFTSIFGFVFISNK